MKTMKKILLMLTILLSGIPLLKNQSFYTVCASENPVVLKMLYSGADVRWVASMERLCAEFMEQNSDILILTETSSEADCANELKIKEALDEFPDVFELNNVNPFVFAGKLGVLDKELSDIVTSPVTVDGKVYGLPTFVGTNGIVYNKEIFKKYNLQIPTTYEEFLTCCEYLKEQGEGPIALGGSQEDQLLYWLNYFFLRDVISQDSEWLQKKGRGEVNFTDPLPLKMLTEYSELVTSGYILKDSINMNDNILVMKMLDNEFAMIEAGPWLFSKIVDAYPDSVSSDKTNLGEMIPREEDPVTYRVGWFFLKTDLDETLVLRQNHSCWSVSLDCMKDPVKKQAAEKFLKFFYKKEHYRDILQEMYGLPATKEAVIYAAANMQRNLLDSYRYAEKTEEYLGKDDTEGNLINDLSKLMYSLYTKELTAREVAEILDDIWPIEP